jgi:hypothetical protein
MMNHTRSTRSETKGALFTSFIAVCSIVLCLLAVSPLCKAQLTTTGTINGTVVDQSGAAIPGAKVSITQTDTGTVTQTVSNSLGNFYQVGLNSGHYEVMVSSSGFTTYRETKIYLEPTGTYTVKAMLKPSAVAETVTVTGTEQQVETITPEVSSTVSGMEAQELPLNGRNYEGLGALMPGVVNTGVGTAMGSGGYATTNSLSINGQGTIGSLYILDGVWNFDTVEHNQNTIMPNPDEISEIKVLQNDYSTKYDLIGTGVIVIQTKSGGDTYHGDGWEFLRNTFLDSRPYFIPASSGTPPEEWNIFGYDLGGPLGIPKVGGIKKTYFYFNNQYIRQKNESVPVVTGATPTATMRGIGTSGNNALFPGTSGSPIPGSGGPYGVAFLTDPAQPAGHCSSVTNDSSCFQQDASGNWIVPASRIDHNALYYLNTMANLPNNQTTAFNNYVNSGPQVNDQMDILAKIDHEFSPKLRLSGEWNIENNTNHNPNFSRMGSPFSTNWDIFTSTDEIGKLELTQVISSSMTNETNVSMSSMAETHLASGITQLSQLTGFTQKLPYSGNFLQNYIPFVQFSGGWSEFGASSCCLVPNANVLYDGVADDWGWLHGKHYVEAGITYLRGHTRQWNGASNTGSPLSNGSFTFNGSFTGNSIADYLLGDTSSFSQSAGAFRKYMQYPVVSPYVEDTWKLTRRLTVTGGLRWMYMPWANTQAGDTAVFEPSQFVASQAPASISIAGVINSAPGTYNAINGMIINGQNGVPLNLLIAQHKSYLSPILGFAWDVFGNGRTSLRGGYAVTYDKQIEGDCASLCVNPPLVQETALINVPFSQPAAAATPTANSSSSLDLHNYRAAQVQSYNLSVQQQFKGWILSVTGAGDATAHMPISNVNATPFPLNQPQPTTIAGVGYDFNPNLNNSAYASSYYAPYQGYSSIGLYTSILKGNWAALEASARHPVGHNLYLTAAYTWSHNLDNIGGWVNPNKLHTAWGNSTATSGSVTGGQNVPQLFTVSVVYNIPIFQGSTGWAHTLLGGWKLSDITTAESGSSLTVGVTGSGFGLATTPNLLARVAYPKQWKAYKYGSSDYWFNPGGASGGTVTSGVRCGAVFCQPAAGYYGTSGNGTVHGPGIQNYDMSLHKEFPIMEALKLEFRADYFNVFNHTEPTSVNTTFGNGSFGTVTAAKEPRIGELSMKFNF